MRLRSPTRAQNYSKVPCFSRTTPPHIFVVGRGDDGRGFRRFLSMWEELLFLGFDKPGILRLAQQASALQLSKTDGACACGDI